MEDTVTLNGKEITRQKLQEEQQKAQSTKGVKIVEVSPGVFKKLLQD